MYPFDSIVRFAKLFVAGSMVITLLPVNAPHLTVVPGPRPLSVMTPLFVVLTATFRDKELPDRVIAALLPMVSEPAINAPLPERFNMPLLTTTLPATRLPPLKLYEPKLRVSVLFTVLLPPV